MQRAPRIKVFLDDRQEIGARHCGVGAVARSPRQVFADEAVAEGLVGRHAGARVDGQAAADEVARGEGHAAPVFEGREGVVGYKDGLHFFEVGVAVEGRVAAEKEVRYYADGPDVAVSHGGC